MWYMLPCSPDLRAKPFWRVAGAWNGFAPVISIIRPERLRRVTPAGDMSAYD